MSNDLAGLWVQLTTDEQSACERIHAREFQWPQLQREVVDALGGVERRDVVAWIEGLISKGVLKRQAGTYWLRLAVDLVTLVPPKPTPTEQWAASAPRRAASLPLPKPAVPEIPEVEAVPDSAPRIDPERVVLLVSEESQLPVAALKGDSTLPYASQWRGIAVYLIRTHCADEQGRLLTHVEIGVMFSRGAPTIASIYHDVRYLQEHGNEWYIQQIERLENRLGVRKSLASEPEPALQLQRTWGEPQP